MDTEKAAADLKVIRQLMERPIRFSTMSGLSGIWAGLVALAGLAVDHFVSRRLPGEQGVWIILGDWAGVFVLAFAGAWTFTRRREKRQGMPAWSGVKTRVLLTILPPFVAGVGITAIIILRWTFARATPSLDQFDLVPAIWMLFYGVALWQLGEFSPREVRLLGAAFVLAGLATAALFQESPYAALGATFGGFHLIYGAIVWIRYGG
jgi:hypothetical protein